MLRLIKEASPTFFHSVGAETTNTLLCAQLDIINKIKIQQHQQQQKQKNQIKQNIKKTPKNDKNPQTKKKLNKNKNILLFKKNTSI